MTQGSHRPSLASEANEGLPHPAPPPNHYFHPYPFPTHLSTPTLRPPILSILHPPHPTHHPSILSTPTLRPFRPPSFAYFSEFLFVFCCCKWLPWRGETTRLCLSASVCRPPPPFLFSFFLRLRLSFETSAFLCDVEIWQKKVKNKTMFLLSAQRTQVSLF